MNLRPEQQNIRAYLLGQLSEDERERLEQRLLSDDAFYQELLIAEDELMADFVRNDLTETEKARFREHVLPVPEFKDDLVFARALRKYVDRHASASQPIAETTTPKVSAFWAFFQRPQVGFAMAALLLVAFLGIAWMIISNRQLQRELTAQQGRTASEELTAERQKNADLTAKLQSAEEQRASAERQLAELQTGQKPSPSPQTPVFATFLLTAGGVRGSGSTNAVKLNTGTTDVQLNADLPADDYRSYQAVLKAADGRAVGTFNGLRAQRGAGRIVVPVSVKASALKPGDYELQLNGRSSDGKVSEIESYFFRVVP